MEAGRRYRRLLGHRRSADLLLSTDPDRQRRRALITLCVTETVSWGILYYAFPVALAAISRDTGWSTSWATAAFSAGLVVSAVAGIPVGRLLHRHGPRAVMTVASVLGVIALVSIATAPTLPLFFVAWMLAGVAMAGVLYQPAFAALTGWYGQRRVAAITAVTLAGGLASTVFAPLTDLLLQHFSWRTCYLVLAAVLAVSTIPAHAVFLTPRWDRVVGRPRSGRDGSSDVVRTVVRSRPFVMLSVALTITAFGLYAASLTLIPLLTDRGLSASLAAITLGLLGVGQLLGRSLYGTLAGRASTGARIVGLLGAAASVLALLAAVSAPAAALITLALLLGAVRGASTLLQATVVADRWGTAQYAALSGWFSAPITLATALAPWGGTAIAAGLGSHAVPLAGYAVLIIVAIGVVTMTRERPAAPEQLTR